MVAYNVVLFESTTHALRAEKILIQARVPIKMIPTPRQLSANCGLALRFERAEAARVEAALVENNVPYNGIYELQG